MKQILSLFRGLRAAFSDSAVRGLLGFTFTLITCAALFYQYVEGWGPIDAFYFSVMTISTVGYGDITPQTSIGKIFTIFYVLIGIGLFVTAASALAAVILKTRGLVVESDQEPSEADEL